MIGRYGGLFGKLKWLNGSFSLFFFLFLVILPFSLFFPLTVDSTVLSTLVSYLSHLTLFLVRNPTMVGMYWRSMLDPNVGNAMPSTDEASNIR